MLVAAPIAATICSAGSTPRSEATRGGFTYLPGITSPDRLVAPTGRPIRVAFAIDPGVQVIDTAGPWETFLRPLLKISTLSNVRSV